jgi:hypothetical protein
MSYSGEPTKCFFDFATGLYAQGQVIQELLIGFYTVEVCELAC